MPQCTLYVDRFWISPYAFTAYVALEEKGVSFDVKTVSLGDGEHQAPEYQRRSITGRVPMLVHGDFALAESSAIAEYVDEAFDGPRLLPGDPHQRARARQVMAWLRTDMMSIREERPTSTMFYERAKKPLSMKAQNAVEKLLDVAGRLVDFAAAGQPDSVRPSAAGATSLFKSWSLADAELGFMLHRLILNGDHVPDNLRDYARAQWERPSITSFVNHERPPFEPY